MFDTRELGRRPGALTRLSRTVEAPADLGVEFLGVPQGAPVEIELRLESVMDGVLVTGTARAPLTGECVRCLEPLRRETEAEFQEMYAYPDADGAHRAVDDGEDAEEETLRLQGDLFDLEPVLRDAIVLSLPLQPVCEEDCPGLCVQCGARLADDPDHGHEAAIDPRWAALQNLSGESGTTASGTTRDPESHGAPEETPHPRGD